MVSEVPQQALESSPRQPVAADCNLNNSSTNPTDTITGHFNLLNEKQGTQGKGPKNRNRHISISRVWAKGCPGGESLPRP